MKRLPLFVMCLLLSACFGEECIKVNDVIFTKEEMMKNVTAGKSVPPELPIRGIFRFEKEEDGTYKLTRVNFKARSNTLRPSGIGLDLPNIGGISQRIIDNSERVSCDTKEVFIGRKKSQPVRL